jgi:hypothetical protein
MSMSCYFRTLSLAYVGFTLADHPSSISSALARSDRSSPISITLARSGGVKRRSRNPDLAFELQKLEVSIADQDAKIDDMETQIKDLHRKLNEATGETIMNFLCSRIMSLDTDRSKLIDYRGELFAEKRHIFGMIANSLNRSSGSAATEVWSSSDD